MATVFKQGTDQTFVAKLSLDWNNVTQFRCSFTQGNTKNCFLILEKNRFTYEDGLIRATLTQEESFMFPANDIVLVQMRAEVNEQWQLSNTVKTIVVESYDKAVIE